ncbi:uncharacterized protein [Epargyreus clarus]
MPTASQCALAALALCHLLGGLAAAQAQQYSRRWPMRSSELYEEESDAEPAYSPRASSAPALPPAAAAGASWPFQPMQINVDLGRHAAGVVPLVLVPVPVPQAAPAANTECKATSTQRNNRNKLGQDTYEEFYREPAPPRRQRPPARPPAYDWVDHARDQPRDQPSYQPSDQPRDQPGHQLSYLPGHQPSYQPGHQPSYQPGEQTHDQPPYQPNEQLPEPSVTYTPDETVSPQNPPVETFLSSQQLVEEFRNQRPNAPELPPMLLSEYDSSERAPIPYGDSSESSPPGADVFLAADGGAANQKRQATAAGAREPPRPRLQPPPLMRAHLTVPRADFTEPYTVWYDQASGAARVDYHGGTTTTYRTMLPDGTVQRAEVRVDRSGESAVRRCAVASSPRAPADRAHPALPDMQQFSFGEYEESPDGRVEVWRRTVGGRAGQLGGARGEALAARHELRLLRAADRAVPLRYTVMVDSSTLGPDSDGYQHFYQYEEAQPLDSKFFNVDLEKLCDTIEHLNVSSPEDVARLEPLREFTLPHRDIRYDEIFKRFKTQFQRRYVDDKEEAVRKNLLIQNVRFISSGNRQGSTSELGVNFLADRAGTELQRLMGVQLAAERVPGEAFPHSRDHVRMQQRRLPRAFDWRAEGGVTPVRFQGTTCASCWAFAVAGAVEGALFRRARRLVPLSEQSMVDCAHPYGGKGCEGTWPSRAFNYVEERGLPALDDYPYTAKVGKCVDESVPSQTRISAHVNVTAYSVPALKLAIRKHAPSVVIVDANCKSFQFHKTGVLYDDRCAKTLKKLDHAVLAVGWGERQGEPHFILKNSWSEAWCERGYIRVQARANTCGVLTKPSFPRLEHPDVAQPLRAAARL